MTDESVRLGTDRYPFFGSNPEAGGNENYYDGDLGDFDGDGQPDRLLGARYGLLFNRGGGDMVPIRRYVGSLLRGDPGASGWGEDAMALIDVDGDGDLDSISGGNGERLSCQRNEGWRFSTLWSETGRSALNIVPTDLEQDGDVDLLVGHGFCLQSSCGGPRSFRVLVNDGTGNYTDGTAASGLALPSGTFITGVVSGDIDGDGDFDVITERGTATTFGVQVALNNGSGVFTTSFNPLHVSCSGFSQNMSLGDIDDDGDLDLAIGRCLSEGSPSEVAGPYTGGHPTVPHLIATNDGSGVFTDVSSTFFDSTAWTGGDLGGGDIALVDIDYDGDLDFLAFQSRADFASHPNHHFQIYLNDGTGRMVYSTHSMEWPGRASGLGADVDLSDFDNDGDYDVWLGVGADIVRILFNTHVATGGVPADLPRSARTVSADATGVTIGWQHPPFASNIRRYHVYRSLAPDVEDRDRERIHVVGQSPFLDQDFFGTVDRHTTTESLGDPDVTIVGSEVRFIDRTAVPGVRYYYTVTHVGPEHEESVHTDEVTGVVPRSAGADTTGPELSIVWPDTQTWGRSPRIVVAYGDDDSGVDLSTLDVSFDRPLGPVSAGTNLTSMAYRLDGDAMVAWLAPPHELPADTVVNITARISDRAGNTTTETTRFFVNILPAIVASPALPTASFTASPTSGMAPLDIDFDASASDDSDGHVMRWEWYFGDGRTALGRQVQHRFEYGGTFDVRLVVRDNEGGVATTTQAITLTGPPPPADAGPPAGDAGTCTPDCSGRTCGDDGCGGVCGTCDAGLVCAGGSCACAGSTEVCGDACVDTRTDAANCGACGTVCGAGERCSAGACGTGPCTPDCSGRTCGGDGCGGTCGDCASGQVCASGGVCQCEGGGTGCGTDCVDVRSDRNHCGGCGIECGDEESCMSGVCQGLDLDGGVRGDGGTGPEVTGDCGCRVMSGQAPSWPSALVLGLGALVARRRRRA
ncbi:MAG: FG-GAP-like repeat-containing protein [Sandaracinaceae bacterium]